MDDITNKTDLQTGMTHAEVQVLRERWGPNRLPEAEVPSAVRLFLGQFMHPLIYILLAAALASVLIGEEVDALFIMLVVLFNATLGAYQEWKAERSASSLKSLLQVKATVVREGVEEEILAEELVPGDVVRLESGKLVPADIRLYQARQLSVDESFLTGESVAVAKETQDETPADAFAGSLVLTGRGVGVVFATGMRTEVGRIAGKLSSTESSRPPLVIRMERFVRQISFVLLIISVALATILVWQGLSYSDVFFLVIALAVSAIPEGLPVAITVALSIASSRMAGRKVIVRKLNAVESLGSCTLIASDKTGTLTVNQQTVRKLVFPSGASVQISGEGYNGDGEVSEVLEETSVLLEAAVLANEGTLYKKADTWKYAGDAMDAALLAAAFKAGMNPSEVRSRHVQIDSIPYESAAKFSAVMHQTPNGLMVSAKGALETILNFCDRPSSMQEMEHQANALAEEGYRVLAIASGYVEESGSNFSIEQLKGLRFLGLAAFIDPLRPDAREAVDRSRRAGIRVVMITGDHKATAENIAKKLHILKRGEAVLTGDDLEACSGLAEAVFDRLVDSAQVFARVSPIQKMQIVDSFVRMGHFVAVTGDGVNDAPAMHRANIGVAMGSGTDVARETGELIIADDQFSSIVAGVEEGRFAYDNVRKVIFLVISTGIAEVLLIFLALLFGLPLPLLAVQILWLNLVTNGIQDVALAFEAGEPAAMTRKPRPPREKIFNPQMVTQVLFSGVLMAFLAFGLWYYLLHFLHWGEASARNGVLLFMVFLQNVHTFNCRSESESIFRIPLNRNPILILGVGLALGLHLLCMYLPFMQNLLGLMPLSIKQYGQLFLLALPLLLGMEVFKWVKHQRAERFAGI
jgi:calcium-translocating P-type ATPase